MVGAIRFYPPCRVNYANMRHKRSLRSRVIPGFILLLLLNLSACQNFLPPAQATATPQPTRRPAPTVTSTPDETATLAAELQASPRALDGTEITYWHPLDGESGTVMMQLVNEFNQSNPYGIFVNPTNFFNEIELAKAVEAAAAGGTSMPTVLAASPDQIHEWNAEWGRITDLTPYLANPSIGFTDQQIADFFPSFFPQVQNGEPRLGLPAYRTGEVLYYNQSWAQELGFQDPPSTPEEFKIQACAAFKANSDDRINANDGTGGWFIDTTWPSAASWLKAFSFHQFPEGGEGVFTFSGPAAEQAFLFLRDLSDSGCAWSGRMTDPAEYFAGRNALFISDTLEDIASQADTNARLNSTDEWIPIPYPAQSGSDGVLAFGLDYAMFQHETRETAAGWLFIKWLMDPVRHARLAAAETTFPLSYSEIALLGKLGEQNPAWQQALGFISRIKPAPEASDWGMVRRILEDALWRSMQPSVRAEEIPILLRELDATIYEVVNQ